MGTDPVCELSVSGRGKCAEDVGGGIPLRCFWTQELAGGAAFIGCVDPDMAVAESGVISPSGRSVDFCIFRYITCGSPDWTGIHQDDL